MTQTGARIVITGPTGWIGNAFMAAVARDYEPEWAGRVALFGSSARSIVAPDGTRIEMRRLDALCAADVDDAIVVHLAYLTKEKVELLGEHAFNKTNLAIDNLVLSALNQAHPRAVFVASSGAAAAAADGRDNHPYGLAKLKQEDRFLAWGQQSGVPVLAGRIYNLAGPWINKLGAYALSAFIVQALAERRITIEATVPVYRSYLHVNDLCRLVLATLDDRTAPAHAIDLCGAQEVEMADVAQAVAHVCGLSQADIARGEIDFDRPARYLGDPAATEALARHAGVALLPFVNQVGDTVRFVRSLGLY